MSRGFRLTLLWLAGGTGVLLFALNWLPSVLVEGHYLPLGNDSFYHARRILDTIAEPAAFYQFDPKIHAPEGSWLTWPWGYDLALAWLTRAIMAVSGITDPMKILVYWPPLWSYINVALLIGITGVLRLGFGLRVLAVVIYALLPLTLALHAVGHLDHHYMEHSFVLLELLLSLRWLQQPASGARALLLGLCLGLAPVVHNGLFMLQLPVLAALTTIWLRRLPLPSSHTLAALVAGLLSTTGLILLPSEPFQAGQFAFTTLSWFHLYIAACTSLTVLTLTRLRPDCSGLFRLFLLALLLGIPLLRELDYGYRFLTGGILMFDQLLETRSLPGQLAEKGMGNLLSQYSGLLLLYPLAMVLALVQVMRETSVWRLAFAIHVLFGGSLMLAQLRLHYFGSYVLYLPLLAALNGLRPRLAKNGSYWALAGTTAVLFILAQTPSVPLLLHRPPIAGSGHYALTRRLYPVLEWACNQAPGVVLADSDIGHFIRYHTRCAVIANNFLITAQHEHKARLANDLLDSPVRRVLQETPWIDYVVVRWDMRVFRPAEFEVLAGRHANDLRGLLLLPETELPAELQLLAQTQVTDNTGQPRVLQRLFRIIRSINPDGKPVTDRAGFSEPRKQPEGRLPP